MTSSSPFRIIHQTRLSGCEFSCADTRSGATHVQNVQVCTGMTSQWRTQCTLKTFFPVTTTLSDVPLLLLPHHHMTPKTGYQLLTNTKKTMAGLCYYRYIWFKTKVTEALITSSYDLSMALIHPMPHPFTLGDQNLLKHTFSAPVLFLIMSTSVQMVPFPDCWQVSLLCSAAEALCKNKWGVSNTQPEHFSSELHQNHLIFICFYWTCCNIIMFRSQQMLVIQLFSHLTDYIQLCKMWQAVPPQLGLGRLNNTWSYMIIHSD